MASDATTAKRSESMQEALRFILESGEFQLPVLPEVAAELLKQTNDVNCDPATIVQLIKRDQSLTSHLLRNANSARYNLGTHTVSSVQQAVARLGLLKVREIVVVIACQCRIFDVPGFDSDVRHSFQMSLATAVFAQETARVMRLNVEEAFLSGLLHDVGRPILLQALVDRRKGSLLSADDEQLRTAADANRIPLACKLVELWELPSRTSDAIHDQSTPMEADENNPGAAILNLATDLASATLASGAPPTIDSLKHPMITVLNLYPEQVQAILNNHEQVLDWVNSTV